MTERKNVLLIMSDQQRYDTLSCLGHPMVKTPNLDALASQSMLFTESYCVEPLCIPSRNSLFTGQYPHRTGAVMNVGKTDLIHSGRSSLLETFKAGGYKLGLSGKNHCFTDEYAAHWFDFVEEYDHGGKKNGSITQVDKDVRKYIMERRVPGLLEGPMPFAEADCPTHRIAEDGLRFIEQYRDDPFFLFLSFPDPHFPHIVCEPYYSMYRPEEAALEGTDVDWSGLPFTDFVCMQTNGIGTADYTEEQRKRILATYYGQISFVDKAVGVVLEKIRALGLEDDTIVVYCSDHGDFGGRYGVMEKGTLHDILLRIPTLVRIPGWSRNGTTRAQISNIDILPTLMEYLQLEPGAGARMQGMSFLSVLGGEKEDHRTEIYAEGGYPKFPEPDDDVMAFDEIRGKLEMNWEEHLEQFHALRKSKENSGHYAWVKKVYKRGRKATVKIDNWRYAYTVGDKEQLYNLNTDPCETRNLAYQPEYADRKERLKQKLMDWLLTEPLK